MNKIKLLLTFLILGTIPHQAQTPRLEVKILIFFGVSALDIPNVDSMQVVMNVVSIQN
jgi:hypothetical protein